MRKRRVAVLISGAGSNMAALIDASDQGRLPIVCDAASCTEGLLKSAHTATGDQMASIWVIQ